MGEIAILFLMKYFSCNEVNNFEDIYVRSLKVNIINGEVDQVTQVVPAFVYFAKALKKRYKLRVNT
jgi:hypothetical protein